MRSVAGNSLGSRVWFGSVGVAAVAALACLVGGARAAAPPFTIVDLGVLGGGDVSDALAINGVGQVVGTSDAPPGGEPAAFSWTSSGGLVNLGDHTDQAVAVNDSGQVVVQDGVAMFDDIPRSYSWTQAGGLVDLGVLGVPPTCADCRGGASTVANDVNEHGEIVGGSTTSSGGFHAFRWTQAGGMIDLGTLGGTFSEATAINDLGEITGRSVTSTGQTHPFFWTQAGEMVDIGTLGGGFSNPAAINDSGEVVGSSDTSNGASHAFSWTPAGGLVDLGTLGGRFSSARAVSDTGEVVGTSQTAAGDYHGFYWTTASGMVDLGAEAEFPLAVNDHEDVVGYTVRPGDALSAFSWTPSGGLVDLPTLGGHQAQAEAINEAGQIVGFSETADGGAHAVLWQPHQDSTPPVLSVPPTMTVPATAPDGATASFQASATDNVDGSVAVSCTPPSGSLFPIGDTQVTCTATDSSGNTAEAIFTIHVEDASEQLADLTAATGALGPGNSLRQKAAAAANAIRRANLSATCGILRALRNELKSQAGHTIPDQTATTLTAVIDRISAVLRC